MIEPVLDSFRLRDLLQFHVSLDRLKNFDQDLLARGEYVRAEGLTDHRFNSQELLHLFTKTGWAVEEIVGIYPFFDLIPSEKPAERLDHDCPLGDRVRIVLPESP
jgi:hypothetical protein